MTKKSIAWLCNYNDNSKINLYRLATSFPNIIEAPTFYELSKKEDNKTLSPDEKIKVDKLRRALVGVQNNWEKGGLIAKENMPSKVFLKENSELPKSTDYILQISNAFLLVNQTCYDILKQYNLGNTHFSQVFIYDMETQKQLSDTPYYFINIAETREFFDAENSKGVEASRLLPKEVPLRYILNPKNDDIKLQKTIDTCDVDLWHDPNLVNSLFFSNKLIDAFSKVGISDNDLAIVSCKTI